MSRRLSRSFRTRPPALALLGVLAACGAPDVPAGLVDPLPATMMEWLHPDSVRTVRLGSEVTYRYVWSAEGPWAMHLVRAELDRCDLGLEVVAAPVAEGASGGRARVSDLVAGHPRRVVAAVNGDFFTPEGRPLGPEVVGGAVRTRTSRDALVFRGGDVPLLQRSGVRREGDGWRVGPVEWRADDTGVAGVQVVGGFPELLDEGERVGDLLVRENPSFAASRHPRTAVGWDAETRSFWIVVVDGRQGAYSTGMTLPELTRVFEELGAEEALNLDGGGSSVLVLNGVAVSHPSDATGERPVANALLLVNDPGFCGPAR